MRAGKAELSRIREAAQPGTELGLGVTPGKKDTQTVTWGRRTVRLA